MPVDEMIGNSLEFLEMLRKIKKLAGVNIPVLIEGETGTGKELAARALHYAGPRSNRPFVPFNCGAMPDGLLESELFGHSRGAFTDARQDAPGLVGIAEGGTLFLDEVDTLSPRAQVSLLRFLQDQCYRPLGGRIELKADVRLVGATNADLMTLVREGRFRRDLYYRLHIVSVELPPLRRRAGDATLLAAYFLSKCASEYSGPDKKLRPEMTLWLDRYEWPGNVRELESLIHREYLLSAGLELGPVREQGDCVDRRKIPDRRLPVVENVTFSRAKLASIDAFENQYLTRLMRHAAGNVSLAAKIAAKDRRALRRLLDKHHINRLDFCDV